MKKQIILYTVCLAAMMSSCHIYKSYDRPEVDTQGLYRDPVSDNDTLASDTTNMGNLPWEQVFTDPQLQALIRLGLKQNTDLQSAIQNVKAAEAGLMSARLAYAPSLAIAPQGGVSHLEGSKRSWTYTLPISASWEVDLFGKLLNSKRGAKVALLQSKAYKQAVQTQVIATIANCYYTLLMLDKQLAITEETSIIWDKSIETMRSMKEAGIEADIIEDGKTFEENAMIKATEIAKIANQMPEYKNAVVLADDSGLEIDYLNKEPGIYSARYMGEDTSYDIKNQTLLDRLEGVPDEKRTARFVCAIAAAMPDGSCEVVRGTMEGIIGHEIAGENGFGYDPIFFLPEYGCTSAELSPEKKNELSHRGEGLRKIRKILEHK